MFGGSSSPPKDGAAVEADATVGSPPNDTIKTATTSTNEAGSPSRNLTEDAAGGEKRSGHSPGRSTSEPTGMGEKKRRSSGVGSKASSFLASAKNSLHFSPSPNSAGFGKSLENSQTPLQKLGKQDPALSVPQGQHNNSAGESLPGPRSTFQVGVWEDKNKKCRRTMEDTHAFLYNFLCTPAPAIKGETAIESQSQKSSEELTNASGTSLSAENSSIDMIETDNGYFAIFDGHAGTFAADWCGKKLHIILEEMIRKNPNTPIPELLDQTFTNVDQQLSVLPVKNSGCTAVTAVLRWEDRIPNAQSATGSTAIAPATAAAVKAAEEASKSEDKSADSGVDMSKSSGTPPNPAAGVAASISSGASTSEAAHAKLKTSATRQRVLYTANVGDARIILCRNGKALRLSYDHKGSDENEGKRVASAGGMILNNRVNGVLAVTRALGDAYMKNLVTGHPYTTETVIQPDLDEFIILACDGLWDVCTDQEAVDLVRNIADPVVGSKTLVDHALARFSTDNLSCMIVRLNKAKMQEASSSTIGVEGDSLTGGISEAGKIVGDARRRAQEDGANSIGVSGSNSGKGFDAPSPAETGGTGSTAGGASMEKVVEEEVAEGGGEDAAATATGGVEESVPTEVDLKDGAETLSQEQISKLDKEIPNPE